MSKKLTRFLVFSGISALAGAAACYFLVRKAECPPIFSSTKHFDGVDPSGDMAEGLEPAALDTESCEPLAGEL